MLTRCLSRLLAARTHERCSSPRDRPITPAARPGRSVTIAPHGMVATSQPLAAQVGLDVLKQGGNAVDAAIATNAAMGLVEPMSCGIGGDLFAIVWDAKTQKLYGLNASGRAAVQGHAASTSTTKGLNEIPDLRPAELVGARAAWTAGTSCGSSSARMPLAELLAPSIRLRRGRLPGPRGDRRLLAGGRATLAAIPDAARRSCPTARAPRAGEVFKNPDLAATLSRDRRRRPRRLLQGPRSPRRSSRFSDKVGGLLRAEGLRRPHVRPGSSRSARPIAATTSGSSRRRARASPRCRCSTCSKPYDLKKMGPTSPDYWHLFVEAKKLAYADRAKFYADPAFAKVPVDGADLEGVRRRAPAS